MALTDNLVHINGRSLDIIISADGGGGKEKCPASCKRGYLSGRNCPIGICPGAICPGEMSGSQ